MLLLLLYPYGYYLYGAVYGDALFLAAALGAFLLLERDHPVLAGLAGAVATAARPVGIAVVVGLVVLALERRRALTVRPDLPRPLAWARCRPGSTAAGCGRPTPGCCSRWAASPRGARTCGSASATRSCSPTSRRTGASRPTRTPGSRSRSSSSSSGATTAIYAWGLLVQALLAVAALVAVPFVGRRFGWGYGAYVLVLVAMPMIGSKDFQGLGRYLIAAFPVVRARG